MAGPSSTGHARKRQFQPSIASYCNRDVNSSNSHALPRTTSPLSPPLPADTQASLLSVGMRVRKSVPEGYKTHKTLGTEGFPFPSAAPPTSTTTVDRGYGVPSPRKLTPFCGLHKTGGWAAQDAPPSTAPAAMQRDDGSDDEAVPGLSMSQSTLPATQTSFLSFTSKQSRTTKKRGYEEEIEDDLDAYFDEVEDLKSAEQLSSHSERPFARMKGSGMKAASEGPVRIVGEDDFEEAAFLAPLDGMDVDEP